MSIRTLATLGVAVLLGLIAVILVRSYLGNAAQTAATQTGNTGPSVAIVVAARPLARGSVLQADALKVVNYPPDAAPVEAFHSIPDVLSGDNNNPRVALRDMVANEPILGGNISGAGGRLGLSGVVAPGMRAVSIRSGDVAGVGGFVLPGDRVDILLTRSEGGEGTIAQVLAENVRVLGVDQMDNVEANKPVVAKVVTVEVTPEQAQTISLAQAVGQVTLTLRHVADNAPLSHKTMSVADLGGKPHRSGGRSGYSIRVIRGVESSNGLSVSTGTGLKAASSAMPAAVGAP